MNRNDYMRKYMRHYKNQKKKGDKIKMTTKKATKMTIKSVRIIRERLIYRADYSFGVLCVAALVSFLPLFTPEDLRLGVFIYLCIVWSLAAVLIGFADGKQKCYEDVEIESK